MEIWDFRGNISMVHVTDVKRTTLMEQVADDYEQLSKQGRFSKECIPRGYIPDIDWTTIHEDLDQPIRPIKNKKRIWLRPLQHQLHPQRLRDHQVVFLNPNSSSKLPPQGRDMQSINSGSTGTQSSSNRGRWSANCPKAYSLMQWTHTLIWAKIISKHKTPIAARCILIVAMVIFKLKGNQTKVKIIQ